MAVPTQKVRKSPRKTPHAATKPDSTPKSAPKLYAARRPRRRMSNAAGMVESAIPKL